MFYHARQTGVTDLLIAVHPGQERLYRSPTFETFGSERAYQLAWGSPAIAMHLNIARWFEDVPAGHPMKSYLLAPPGPRDDFENYFEWDGESIREMLRKLLVSLSVKEQLRHYYPGLI